MEYPNYDPNYDTIKGNVKGSNKPLSSQASRSVPSVSWECLCLQGAVCSDHQEESSVTSPRKGDDAIHLERRKHSERPCRRPRTARISTSPRPIRGDFPEKVGVAVIRQQEALRNRCRRQVVGVINDHWTH